MEGVATVLDVALPAVRVIETGSGVKALSKVTATAVASGMVAGKALDVVDGAAGRTLDVVDAAAGRSSSKGVDNTMARLMARRAMELLPPPLVRALGEVTGEERGSTAMAGCGDSEAMSLLPVDTRAKRDGAIGGPPIVPPMVPPMTPTVANGGGKGSDAAPPTDGGMIS